MRFTRIQLVLAGATCIAMLAAVLQLQDAPYKSWAVLVGIAVMPTVMVVTGRPKEILLFGWVLALTYNRQYYVFESLVGYNGTQGPYVLLSDVCLAGLFGWWLFERIFRRPDDRPRGAPLWPWLFPFAAICLLSTFEADRPDWGLYEMIRIGKIGLILYYVRRNFGRREWSITLAALGCAVFFQSAVAIKEVITGKAGVLGIASDTSAAPAFVQNFEAGGFTGMVRGMGTLAHPPYLACYLLLLLPVLLALAFTAPRRRAAMFAAAFLAGCGGLAATLSRGPWMLAAVEMVLVIAGLVLLRQVALQRALGLVIVGGFVLMLALLPVKDKLMNRITGDFSESLRYREQGTRAAWNAIDDHPLLGLGLNNTELHFVKYLPEMDWALVTEDFATHTLHLRAPVALGNGFLHVAEETGLLGLGAFLFFVVGALGVGMRSLARTGGEHRAVCLGLMVGILGALGEQFVDTPLWVDPNLYTFALSIGLLSVAAPLFSRGRRTAAAPRMDLAA